MNALQAATNITLLLMHIATTTLAFDYVQFYRAPLFFGEPRFERSGLSSAQATITYGHASHARNQTSDRTNLLNLYGIHHLHHMVAGVDEQQNNPYQTLLQTLAAQPYSKNFATLSLNGSLRTTEVMLDFAQNITHGFFIRAQLPLRHICVSSIQLTNLSPTNGHELKRSNAVWQEILHSIDPLLEQYGLTRSGYRIHGPADLACTFGWTINYDDTGYYDFVDTTIQTGALISLANPQNNNHLLELPLGYNKHNGGFIIFEHSYGLYDWITFGLHFQALFFADSSFTQRIKTDNQQSGLVLLQKEHILEERGNQYVLGLFFKADHFIRGFSLTAGYSYTRQQESSWFLHNHNKPYTLYDERLAGWSMQTFHFIADYDFVDFWHKNLPIIGLVCDIPFYGKRILKTSLLGGSFAINLGWNF